MVAGLVVLGPMVDPAKTIIATRKAGGQQLPAWWHMLALTAIAHLV
jgi:hypothetical protein